MAREPVRAEPDRNIGCAVHERRPGALLPRDVSRNIGATPPREGPGRETAEISPPEREATLPTGLRLMWDTEAGIATFDPDWRAPNGGPRTSLAFLCADAAAVDRLYAELTANGGTGASRAVGCGLGPALRDGRRPGWQFGRPVRCPSATPRKRTAGSAPGRHSGRGRAIGPPVEPPADSDTGDDRHPSRRVHRRRQRQQSDQ